VAALQRGQRMLLERVAPYRLDLAGKLGMKAVDRCHQQGLRLTRRPVHRIQRDRVIDPGAVITGEQEIRQGREDEAEGAQMVTEQATRVEWQVVDLQPTDEKFR